MKRHLSLITALFDLLSVVIAPRTFATSEAPDMEELQQGWKMTAAKKNVSGDEALVCKQDIFRR